MTSERPQIGDRDQLMEFAKHFPFFNLMGIEILDMQPGSSKTRINWRPDLCQPAGIIHGGVIATLVDTGIAHALLLTDLFQTQAAQGGYIVSVDLRIRYFRPFSEGAMTCESTIPKMGRKIVHGESIITNDAGKEIARGESIYMAVEGKQIQKN